MGWAGQGVTADMQAQAKAAGPVRAPTLGEAAPPQMGALLPPLPPRSRTRERRVIDRSRRESRLPRC